MVYSDEINVRGDAVKCIIGINGATIKKLQEDLNVKMKFLGLNSEQYVERTLEIMGMPRDVENAKRRIVEISQGLDDEFPLYPHQFSRSSSANGVMSNEFYVPNSIFRLVIGRDGENLKNIKLSQNLQRIEEVGTCITDDGREMRQITLQGTSESVESAKKLLQQLVDSHLSDRMRRMNNSNGGASMKVSNVDEFSTNVPSLKSKSTTILSEKDFVQSCSNSNSSEHFQNGTSAILPETEVATNLLSKQNMSVQTTTQAKIAKLALCVNNLSEQHNREVERLSRTHCDEIIKASLQFVAKAEREAQNELQVLRKHLAAVEVQLEDSRINKTNSGGIHGVEIADLKNQLRLKDELLNALLAENDQYKSTIDDLTLEMTTLKSQLQNQQLISLDGDIVSDLCKKCAIEPRDTVVMPCLHMTHCITCANQMERCEICNAKITSRLRIRVEKRIGV